MRTPLLLLLASLALCVSLSAQITTDRLGKSHLPQTVDKGHLQLETGLMVEKYIGVRKHQIPQLSLRYGLTDQLELRAYSSYDKYVFNKDIVISPNDPINERGPIGIGLKYDLGKTNDQKWHFAFESEVKFAKRVLRDLYRPNLVSRLIASQRLSSQLQIIHNFAFEQQGFELKGLMTYSPQLRYALNENLSIMVEPSVSYAGGNSRAFFDITAGAAYQIGDRFQLDLSIGRTLSFRRDQLSFGASYLFGR